MLHSINILALRESLVTKLDRRRVFTLLHLLQLLGLLSKIVLTSNTEGGPRGPTNSISFSWVETVSPNRGEEVIQESEVWCE